MNTASLATWFVFGKLIGVATLFDFERSGVVKPSVVRRSHMKPQRLFVIIGDPLWTLDTDLGGPESDYNAPSYSTDPRDYDLDLLDEPVSDDVFERDYKQKIRAFIVREDAIDFANHCNLAGVWNPVFDRVGDEWVQNSDETDKIADNIG